MSDDGRPIAVTRSLVGQSIPHDSASLHVSGEAAYTDDIPEPRDLLHIAIGVSEKAYARIRSIDLHEVSRMPGVVATLLPQDIPGENNFGPILHDDPIFAEKVALYAGHPLFAVAADNVDAARQAARCANIQYQEYDAILDTDTAVARESFVLPSETLARGNPQDTLTGASHRIQRRVLCGGQDQFYLEGHISMAVPEEGGGLTVYSSTNTRMRFRPWLRDPPTLMPRTLSSFAGEWAALLGARKARQHWLHVLLRCLHLKQVVLAS